MKKKANDKIVPNLRRGLAGVLLAVSTFILPVMLYAEGAANVMPQEQVFLDPSQVEAAKKQLEADAVLNAQPQKQAPVANEKEIAAPVVEQKQEAQPAKYVMPEEQVYLDPSQVEAAKKQLEEDAAGKSGPRAKNVEVVTGDRVIADVKVVDKPETEIKPEAAKNVTQNATADNKAEVKKAETEKSIAAQPEKVTTEKPAATAEAKKENKTETLAGQSVIQQKPVRLHHFGLAKEFTTHQGTVGEVLQDMKINLDGRTVYPPLETKITDGMVIHVLARKSFLSREEVEVPFGTQTINDAEMAFGAKKVEKEGVKGKDLVIYENITRPGREQKIELDRQRVLEPVNEIVRQGVAQSILTPEGYVKYKKKIYGEATAYTWGGGATGHTSIGLWPKRGIVAVDPRVIPYYTKLYIPGYGMAIAGDTGGAIVGTRIDLFMDSLHECYQWGRRDVEIYILE